MSFTRDSLPPKKAAGMCVVTNDVVRFSTDAGLALINAELSRAVALSADSALVPLLTSGISPISSTSDPALDLRAAFGALPLGQMSRPFIAAAPDALKQMSLMTGPSGPMFPDLGFLGGSISGVPCAACDALAGTADGDLIIVGDADQLVGDAQDLDLRVTREADIAMVDSASGAQQMVSMFSTNSVAMQLERYFGFAKVRDSATACISHVNYG